MPTIIRPIPVAQATSPFWHSPLLSLIVTVAGSTVASVAAAQEAAAPSADSASASAPAAAAAKAQSRAASATADVQSVTVTATRRREPAREVPMQVTAIPTAQIEQSGAKSLSDYLADIPGVDVRVLGGDGTGAITIRGVSTGMETVTSVGTYIDDVAIGSATAFAAGTRTQLDMGLLDLNHIEVLRGPQGTLYGAGAMGGLLKYVTNEPDTYELSGKLTVGADFTQGGQPSETVSGVINVPLKEDIAGLRISAFRNHVGGYVDAIGPAAGQNINSGSTTGGRVSVLIEPSAHFKIRLTDTAQNLFRAGQSFVDYDPATGKPVNGVDARLISSREPYSTKINVAAADLEYNFGWARLNSITSAQSSRFTQFVDVTNPYAAVLPQLGLLDSPDYTVGSTQRAGVVKQTQEFRLTSAATGTVEWLAGFYFDRESGFNDQTVPTAHLDGSPGPSLIDLAIPTRYREGALYGDVTWNLTPDVQITGGIRVARNKETGSQVGGGPLIGGSGDIPSHAAETSKTYLATIRYALTPTSNVYFRAASGYRPGGPNAVIKDSEGNSLFPATFKHDTLWSFEGGYKADLLDKKLSIEAAIFDIRWAGIQQNFSFNNESGLVNGGRAAIDGLELSATYRANHDLTLGGNFSFNHARLVQDAPGLAASGARLPNSPVLAANFHINQGFTLAGRPAYAGFSERLIGERNAGFQDNAGLPNYREPGYALTDFQGGMTIDKFQLALFVRNLLNKRAQVSADTELVPLGGPVEVNEARPRTIGFTLATQF